jgi:ABC-type multidrug transport system permease subunit
MFLVIVVTISAAIGITLFFVGSLITIAAAFANEKQAFAIACILFMPLTILYCIMYWPQTRFPSKYVFSGLALFLLTLATTMWVL